MKEKIKKFLTPGLALAGGAALFPYHFVTLQAVNPGAALPLAFVALALSLPCFAIVVFHARDLIAARAKLLALVIAVLAMFLTRAERPFVHGGYGVPLGLALVQAFLIAIFFVAAHSVWKSMRAGTDRPSATTLWIVAGFWLATACGALAWVLSSKTIWLWDYSVYANYSRDLADLIRKAGLFPYGVGAVLDSVKNEYNMIPAVPIALVEAALGRSDRFLLILCIAFFYVAPTMLAGALLLRRCAPGGLGGGWALLIIGLSALIFPVAFFPSLYGMPDIGGVGMVATLIFVALRREAFPGASKDAFAAAAPMIVCGGLLVLVCVFRRWYVFLAPALLALLTAHEFLRQDNRLPIAKRLLAATKGMAVLGAFAGLCGFAFYWARLIEMASQSYAGAYLAYANPIAVEFDHAVWQFGYGPLALFAICALTLLANRASRLAGLAVVVTPVLVAVLFERVQGFSTQHYLLLIPGMIFAIALAATHAIAARPQRRSLVLTALALCAATALFGVFSPGANTFLQRRQIVASADMTPPRRDDLDEVERLTRDLALHADAGAKICVVASGLPMNRTVIRENALTLAPKTNSLLGDKFIWLGDVDRRDGFMPEVATCDVAMLTTPVLLHLAREEQQSIAYLDAAIKSGVGIGAAFRATDQSYRLIDGIEARLYQRIAPIAPEDLRGYSDAVTKKPGTAS